MSVEVVEAASGLYLVIGPRTNWCLIREGDAITLVDAAWPKDYPAVVDSLSQIGATPANIEAVVLTHAHPDHVGVAERLRAEQKTTVHTHREEVGHATGRYRQQVRKIDLVIRLWRPSVLALAVTAVIRGGMRPTPVATVVEFGDSPLDIPGRIVPVPTPGHTSGHCSFHIPEHGIVLTGDALVNHNPITGRSGPRLMPRIFSHDWAQAAASLDKLAPLDAELLLPGHGPPLHMTPANAVRLAKRRLTEGGWWNR